MATIVNSDDRTFLAIALRDITKPNFGFPHIYYACMSIEYTDCTENFKPCIIKSRLSKYFRLILPLIQHKFSEQMNYVLWQS